MSIALVMAIVATLTLEHSQIDLMVAGIGFIWVWGIGWLPSKLFARFATVFWTKKAADGDADLLAGCDHLPCLS